MATTTTFTTTAASNMSASESNNNVVVSSASIFPTVVATIPESVLVTISSSSDSVSSVNVVESNGGPRTRSSTGSSMKVYVSPKPEVPKRPTVVEVNKIVQNNSTNIDLMFEQQKQLTMKLNQIESQCEKRLGVLHGEISLLQSKIFVQDRVSTALREEVDRLQQFTRRPCVSVFGLQKPRDEKPDDLRKKVEEVIGGVGSGTTMDDVDKFHRNGEFKDGEQEVIIRFKSHTVKENFFRARKNQQLVRIYPSLTKQRKSLLYEARDLVKSYPQLKNPPVAVFGDVHGDLTIKFEKKTHRGLYAKFNSLEELSSILEASEACEGEENHGDEPFNVWKYDDVLGFKERE